MGAAYQQLPVTLAGRVGATLSVTDEFGEVVGSALFDIPLDPLEHGKWHLGRQSKGLDESPESNQEPIISEVPLQRGPVVVANTGTSFATRNVATRKLSNKGTGDMEPNSDRK